MLLIRPFETPDAAAVASVILPIQQKEFQIAVTLNSQPDLSDIPNFYQKDRGNFWVAEADGRVVGTIGLLDIGNDQAALRKMFVMEAYRGRTHGVAHGLLGALFAWSENKGLAEIFLGTTDKFLAAHRFYEKNGFLEIAESALPPAFPVMSVDSRFYRRSTAQSY